MTRNATIDSDVIFRLNGMRQHKHVQENSTLIDEVLTNRPFVDKRRSQTHKFKCTVDSCEEVFNERSKLKEHIRIHQGRFRCRICGIIEKSESELSEHKVLHENLDPLDCVLCKKRFKKKGALTRHMRIHVSFREILRIYQSMSRFEHNYIFLFIHFQAGEKFYQCDKCGKEFVHKSSFNMHIMAHDNIRDKSCPHCPLKFRSTSHLNRHIRIHVIFFFCFYASHKIRIKAISLHFLSRPVLNRMRVPNVDKDLPNDTT